MNDNLEKAKISLKNFFVRFASVVDKGDNKGADILLFKAKEKEPENTNDKSKGGNDNMPKTYDEIVKSLPEEEQTVINAEIEKVKAEAKPKEEDKKPEGVASFDEAEVVKSADPKVQEMIKKMKEDNEKLEKDAKEKDEKLQKFESDLKKEKIEKTVATFDRIAMPKEEMVTLFAKLDEETTDLVEKAMKAVNEQLVQANIIKVIGTDAEGDQLTVEETIKKEAEEIAKSEGITKEQAYVKALKKDKTRYAKYQEEQKGV